MKKATFRPIRDIGIVDRTREYVCLRLTGLFGDTIHASTRFNYILDKYPDHPWIILHSYPVPNIAKQRIKLVYEHLMSYWVENGRIHQYFYDVTGRPGDKAAQIPQIMNAIRYCRCLKGRAFDCAVDFPRVDNMVVPNLGITIPEKKDPLKAVIIRYSAWHNHFMGRNRPYAEWFRIERELIKYGYGVTILGIDDPHPNKNNLVDLRGKLNVREVLDYTKDASICITPATFLYVWSQFVCPTFVLSDRGDVANLNANWKLNPNMEVFNVHQKNYMANLFTRIKEVATSNIRNDYTK